MPQKSVANCFCKAVCLSGRLATSCLCGLIAISRHVFYLLKTAIIFYLVFVCRFTPRCFFLFKTTFISLAFCPFTARFFVSVQNCNYVPLTFCRFTPRCFFSKLQLYFIWYLFVVSLHFFVCSKICAVQNNVKYNKYSLLMMNCPTKCNSQKKVVE